MFLNKSKIKAVILFFSCFLFITISYAKSVLVILSDNPNLVLKNGKIYKTGFWLNELMVPVLEMKAAGIKLYYATPSGGVAYSDANSVKSSFFTNKKQYKQALATLKRIGITRSSKNILSFKQVLSDGLSKYDGLFIPGGHGPMVNLYNNKQLGEILNYFHSHRKPTATLCHGPMALLSAKSNGHWVYKDYQMTVFSISEEKEIEQTLPGKMPYYPEIPLKEAGASIQVKPNWQPHVVVDRELITGQNPQSDELMVKAFIRMMKKS